MYCVYCMHIITHPFAYLPGWRSRFAWAALHGAFSLSLRGFSTQILRIFCVNFVNFHNSNLHYLNCREVYSRCVWLETERQMNCLRLPKRKIYFYFFLTCLLYFNQRTHYRTLILKTVLIKKYVFFFKVWPPEKLIWQLLCTVAIIKFFFYYYFFLIWN